MPIYEYACKACGNRVEVLHGIHAAGPATCDICGGPMTKLMSAPAIVFKGSGWAKKDARDRSAARATSADGRAGESRPAEPAASGGDAGTKTESTKGSPSGAESGSGGSARGGGSSSRTGSGSSGSSGGSSTSGSSSASGGSSGSSSSAGHSSSSRVGDR